MPGAVPEIQEIILVIYFCVANYHKTQWLKAIHVYFLMGSVARSLAQLSQALCFRGFHTAVDQGFDQRGSLVCRVRWGRIPFRAQMTVGRSAKIKNCWTEELGGQLVLSQRLLSVLATNTSWRQ